MNRREFLGWLSASGLALALPIRAATARPDERSLFDFSEWQVSGDREGYRIPVRIDGFEPSDICITGTVIDRPVFGIAPRSFMVTQLRWDSENGATAELFLDATNVGHAHEVRLVDGRNPSTVFQTMQVRGLSRCDSLVFVPIMQSQEAA